MARAENGDEEDQFTVLSYITFIHDLFLKDLLSPVYIQHPKSLSVIQIIQNHSLLSRLSVMQGRRGKETTFKPEIHSIKFSKASSLLRSMIKYLLAILWGPLQGSQVVKILKTLHRSQTVTFKEINCHSCSSFLENIPSLQVLWCFWQHLPEFLDC